jgi:hypothetical protein
MLPARVKWSIVFLSYSFYFLSQLLIFQSFFLSFFLCAIRLAGQRMRQGEEIVADDGLE